MNWLRGKIFRWPKDRDPALVHNDVWDMIVTATIGLVIMLLAALLHSQLPDGIVKEITYYLSLGGTFIFWSFGGLAVFLIAGK